MTAASMKTFPKAILVLMSALMVTADASITVMDSGKQFPSRPDKKLGHQLWKESDYMGRLQFVHGNLQLCKSAQDPHHKFSITQTMDGLPGMYQMTVMASYFQSQGIIPSAYSRSIHHFCSCDLRQGRRVPFGRKGACSLDAP